MFSDPFPLFPTVENLLHRNELCADVLSARIKEIPGRAGDERSRFLIIGTESSFGFTKIYTKSNLVVVPFLHEIKAKIWI